MCEGCRLAWSQHPIPFSALGVVNKAWQYHCRDGYLVLLKWKRDVLENRLRRSRRIDTCSITLKLAPEYWLPQPLPVYQF